MICESFYFNKYKLIKFRHTYTQLNLYVPRALGLLNKAIAPHSTASRAVYNTKQCCMILGAVSAILYQNRVACKVLRKYFTTAIHWNTYMHMCTYSHPDVCFPLFYFYRLNSGYIWSSSRLNLLFIFNSHTKEDITQSQRKQSFSF